MNEVIRLYSFAAIMTSIYGVVPLAGWVFATVAVGALYFSGGCFVVTAFCLVQVWRHWR